MNNTTITFRTDQNLKKDATIVFENIGLNLSTAINMFLKQAVLKKTFPCAIDTIIVDEYSVNYNENFFKLFGSGKDLGLDEEPCELSFANDRRESL